MGEKMRRQQTHFKPTCLPKAAQEKPVSKTLDDTKIKLSNKAYMDEKLKAHCDKNPELSDSFRSAYHALGQLQKEIGKDQFYSKTDALHAADSITSSYRQQKTPEHKIAIGEFLADIGFATVVKDIFGKLKAAFPNLLSYDREQGVRDVSLDAESGELANKPDTTDLEKAQDLLNATVFSAINCTDLCDAMNLAFSEAGLVPILVDAVDKLKDCTAHHLQYKDSEGHLWKMTVRGTILSLVMGTLHNLSKRGPTRNNFHACNAVRVLLPLTDDKVPLYATKALIVLAYLIGEDNYNLFMAKTEPIKYLVSLIDKATRKSDHRYLTFSNSELAKGLAQIAINDSNKKEIVANNAIPVLTNMIKRAQNEEERIAAAKALYTLAFDEENKEKMKSDEDCMEMLYKLKESTNDRLQSIERVKEFVSGALWEIEGKQQHVDVTVDKSSSGTTNHVMISYQWDVQKTVIQVKDRLEAAGYRVWLDLEQMAGSTLEAMARAVENSAVVLICVSQKYKERPNCRSEAEYAHQLHKDIIPLMMESNYKPDGWLGIILGAKLRIDFSQHDISKVEASVKNLMKELGNRGKKTDP